jgi:micrococcal nuclease
MRKTLLIVVLIIMASNYAFAENTVNWKDAANHYGKYKTVEGTIVSGKCLPKVCFFNFNQDYRTAFTVVIFASDLSKFPPNPDQFYRNKKVQVTGTIKEYKGKPEIIIKGTDQIKITK